MTELVINHFIARAVGRGGGQHLALICLFVCLFFLGALNHQTAHHLFPGVSQIYYPQITPIIREACKEFGVRYNYKDTIFQALGCHVAHLKRLGQQQEKASSTRHEG